jgi:PHB de-polymerase C-terminus
LVAPSAMSVRIRRCLTDSGPRTASGRHRNPRTLAPGGDLMLYQSLVAAHGGVMKGEYLLAGFIALRPQDELAKQLGVLRAARDPAAADRYRRFEDWYKHTQDLPGRFYLWIVEHLFRDNELVAGELEVGGEHVDLRRITCPLNLIAGAKDHITPPDQVFVAAGAAGTAPDDVFRRLTGGGHLGLFMGREALSEHWPGAGAHPRGLAAIALVLQALEFGRLSLTRCIRTARRRCCVTTLASRSSATGRPRACSSSTRNGRATGSSSCSATETAGPVRSIASPRSRALGCATSCGSPESHRSAPRS